MVLRHFPLPVSVYSHDFKRCKRCTKPAACSMRAMAYPPFVLQPLDECRLSSVCALCIGAVLPWMKKRPGYFPPSESLPLHSTGTEGRPRQGRKTQPAGKPCVASALPERPVFDHG